ncbi:MAG: amidohydrolase family protein, partial [Pseudoxanthomonas sp.]
MRLCVLAAVLSVACAPAFAATTFVKAGRLLDVESGRMLTDQAIVIEDTR